MTNEAAKAIENSFHMECKKDAMKQLQSGEWSISFKVLAEDIPVGLLTAPMGTRFVVAACEKNDDETPKQQSPEAKETPKAGGKLAKEAGMLCNAKLFINFLRQSHAATWRIASAHPRFHEEPSDSDVAAQCVRQICGVHSRSEIDEYPTAREYWTDLMKDYHRFMSRTI